MDVPFSWNCSPTAFAGTRFDEFDSSLLLLSGWVDGRVAVMGLGLKGGGGEEKNKCLVSLSLSLSSGQPLPKKKEMDKWTLMARVCLFPSSLILPPPDAADALRCACVRAVLISSISVRATHTYTILLCSDANDSSRSRRRRRRPSVPYLSISLYSSSLCCFSVWCAGHFFLFLNGLFSFL